MMRERPYPDQNTRAQIVALVVLLCAPTLILPWFIPYPVHILVSMVWGAGIGVFVASLEDRSPPKDSKR